MAPADTAYKGATYWGVMHAQAEYHGWRVWNVGNGRMSFKRGSEYCGFKEVTAGSDGWMRECWEAFIDFVQAEANAPGPSVGEKGERG